MTLWTGTEPQEYPDPDPDDLTRDELAEMYPQVYAVALTLDEWLLREHGVIASHHHAEAFLKYLALRGYEVAEKPPLPSWPNEQEKEPTMNDLGQLAYDAYARSVGGKTNDGRDMPVWDDLGRRMRTAWRAGAAAVESWVRREMVEG